MKCRLMFLAAALGAGVLCTDAQAQYYSTRSPSNVKVTRVSPISNHTVVRMGGPVQAEGGIVTKEGYVDGGAPVAGCDTCNGGYAGGCCGGIWDDYCGSGCGLGARHRFGGCLNRGGYLKHGCGYHYAGLGYAGCCSSWASPWWGWGYSGGGCGSCSYSCGCGHHGLLHRHCGGLGLLHRHRGACCSIGDSCCDSVGCTGCAAGGYDKVIEGPIQGPAKGIIEEAPKQAEPPVPAPEAEGKSASRTSPRRYTTTSYRMPVPASLGR